MAPVGTTLWSGVRSWARRCVSILGCPSSSWLRPHLGEGPKQNRHLFRAGWRNKTQRNDPRLNTWRIEEYDKEIKRTGAKRRSEGMVGAPLHSPTLSRPSTFPPSPRISACRAPASSHLREEQDLPRQSILAPRSKTR